MTKKGKEQKKDSKKTSTGKKIGSTVVTVFLVILLAFVVYTFVQLKTAKRPNLFGFGVYTVISGSMVPTLEIGDVIIIKQVHSESELKHNDIITFVGRGDFEGKIVTHRIVSEGVEDGKIRTCGDANHGIVDKTPVEYSDVLGKYVHTSVVMSFIYKAFRSKTGFGVIVFVPLMVLLAVQIVNFVHACKMKDEDEPNPEKDAEEAVRQKEEEIRRKAVEEYIASKKRLEDAQKKKKK